MAKRSKAQKIGSLGQRIVQMLIEESGKWIVRGQEEDFGVDVEIELSEPEVMGHIVKVQVKSLKRVKPKNGTLRLSLKKSFLRYAEACRIPVVLVIVDTTRKEAWYLWLQLWLLEGGSEALNNTRRKFTSVSIPLSDTLEFGLAGPLQEIAKWNNQPQLILSLREVIRTAASLDKPDVAFGVVRLLQQVNAAYVDFPIGLLIREVMKLGPRIWATEEGNELSRLLYSACHTHGFRFTAEDAVRLVIRGDSYSRTGINALGFLYSDFFEHTKSLGLPDKFASLGQEEVAYYCRLRERYPGKDAFTFASQATKLDFAIDGWDLHPSIDIDKVANRGESAILDFMIRAQSKRRPTND